MEMLTMIRVRPRNARREAFASLLQSKGVSAALLAGWTLPPAGNYLVVPSNECRKAEELIENFDDFGPTDLSEYGLTCPNCGNRAKRITFGPAKKFYAITLGLWIPLLALLILRHALGFEFFTIALAVFMLGAYIVVRKLPRPGYKCPHCEHRWESGSGLVRGAP